MANEGLPNVAANSVAIEYTWESDTGQITRSLGPAYANPIVDFYPPYSFTDYKNGVKVEYNGGFDTIPLDLKIAVLDYVKIMHKQEQSSQAVNFQGETKQSVSLQANWPAHIRRVLDLYRII
jgi:hypothetical protein